MSREEKLREIEELLNDQPPRSLNIKVKGEEVENAQLPISQWFESIIIEEPTVEVSDAKCAKQLKTLITRLKI